MGIVVPSKLFLDTPIVGRATDTATMVKQSTIQVENSKFSYGSNGALFYNPAADWLKLVIDILVKQTNEYSTY